MSEKRKNSKGQSLPRGIDQLEPGKYRGRATVGGVSISVYGDTITETKKRLERERLDAQEGRRATKSSITFGEQLAQWLEGKRSSRALKTVDGYGYVIAHYLSNALKSMKLQEIRPHHLRSFYTPLEARYRPGTLRQIGAVVGGCLGEAHRLELIPTNPALKARPSLERSKDSELDEEEFKAYTPDEARRFLGACRADRWGMVFEFILSTGVRRGEACGLRWENVNLEQGTARVLETLTPVDGKTTRTAPKNRSSRRTLHLSPETLGLLERVKVQTALEQAIHGGRFKPSEYVFTGPLGGPLEQDVLGRYMNKLSSAAGVGRLSPHALRHTYASLALRAGIPVDVVSKQLGHASVTMTLNVYRTVYRSELERWAYSLTQLLEGSG